MSAVYVLDYNYLKRDYNLITELELNNEVYLVKYKESEYEDDDLKLAYAILQF